MRYARSQRSYRSSVLREAFDNSPSVDASSNDAQAASDAQVQATQSMNDANALNASTAAAGAQRRFRRRRFKPSSTPTTEGDGRRYKRLCPRNHPIDA
jgi:hypothetical protein